MSCRRTSPKARAPSSDSNNARQRTVSKWTRTPNPPITLFLQPASLCFPCTSLSSLPRCFPSLRAARKISPSILFPSYIRCTSHLLHPCSPILSTLSSPLLPKCIDNNISFRLFSSLFYFYKYTYISIPFQLFITLA